MTKDEALKLALEAWQTSVYGSESHHKAMLLAMTNMAQALAAPTVQEPVAWEQYAIKFAKGKKLTYEKPKNLPSYIGVRALVYADTAPPAQEFVCSTGLCHYKAQREWVGLSEEEIDKLKHLIDWTATWSHGRFAYEIEQLLKEKNA